MAKTRRIANVPNAPAFSAFRTAKQNLVTDTLTKIQFDGEEFDTANAYDAVTNHRFQPQVAGYYQVNSCLQFAGVSLTLGLVVLYKNGAFFKRGNDIRATMAQYLGATLSTLVYMNGTTDYLEIFGYASGTTLRVEGVNGTDNYFQACLVRPA